MASSPASKNFFISSLLTRCTRTYSGVHFLRVPGMAKRLVPLLDRVLVEKLAPPTKTVGGVLLPETASKVRDACRAQCAARGM